MSTLVSGKHFTRICSDPRSSGGLGGMDGTQKTIGEVGEIRYRFDNGDFKFL